MLMDAPAVAVLCGPTEVIEAVVRRASDKSGLLMDWHFAGGRGIVRSWCNRDKCRSALYTSCVTSDLSTEDL
jgi:hypothetical protein